MKKGKTAKHVSNVHFLAPKNETVTVIVSCDPVEYIDSL
jgi:hypothetical protein